MQNKLTGLSSRVLLVILDGFGINEKSTKNAIKAAKKPHIDDLFAHYPYTTITGGGELVGLPKGVAGNSEVGHINLGAGRPVRQDLVRINEAIEQGKLCQMSKMQELISQAKLGTKRIHVMGLLSDGGVHSHIDHIKAVITCLSKNPDLKVFFHAFMDGRDTAPDVGEKYIPELKSISGFEFASMQGRSIGMDRDRRWEKIKRCLDMLAGKATIVDCGPEKYIKQQYAKGITDEFIEPALFNPNAAIKDEDCVFFINFRPDRAKQITLALTDPKFKEFNTPIRSSYFLCMSPYVPDEVELPILFDKEKVKGVLGEYLSQKKLKQFRIAETEKYAHVTYFFNGGEEKPFPGETRTLISSPKDVNTYDEKPEMSAYEVTEKLVAAIKDDQYSFYLVNYANPDMVGHTGNFEAAVKAIEHIDHCMGDVMQACLDNNVCMLLTADHGNSDQMVHPDGTPHTSHSNAPVPFVIFHPKLKDVKLELNTHQGALKDVAPTVLEIMGLPLPKDFTGESIFH